MLLEASSGGTSDREDCPVELGFSCDGYLIDGELPSGAKTEEALEDRLGRERPVQLAALGRVERAFHLGRWTPRLDGFRPRMLK